MNLIEQAIDTIQKKSQICIKEFSKAAAHETQYFVRDDKLIVLQLSELHLENFDAFLPVFKIVKKLELFYCTFNTNNIIEGLKQFTELESICVTVDSILTVPFFLQLEMLKDLELFIDYDILPKNALTLDFKGLSNIENLRIYSDNVNSDKIIIFKGAEYLTTLKKLSLECDCLIDKLNKFKNLQYLHTECIHFHLTHKLETLKTLEIHAPHEGYKIDSLEQFPNLENLKITGYDYINLGELKKLKILSICSPRFELENTKAFNNLPNLEQLELMGCKISEIKNLDHLLNLKVINLSENFTIKNINGLNKLTKLEYINLYKNQISDLNVLNKLPNLKEVNVAGNNINQEDANKQLDNPEIARFLCYPYMPANNVPFDIWKNIN